MRNNYQAMIEILETRGWCQHNTTNAAGEHCLIGAIEAEKGTIGPFYKHPKIIEFGDSISRFNDSRTTTKADVIQVIRDMDQIYDR